MLVEADGGKLAKSARSVRLEARVALPQLLCVFELLGLAAAARSGDGHDWRGVGLGASERWDINRVPKRLTLPLAGCKQPASRQKSRLALALHCAIL